MTHRGNIPMVCDSCLLRFRDGARKCPYCGRRLRIPTSEEMKDVHGDYMAFETAPPALRMAMRRSWRKFVDDGDD